MIWRKENVRGPVLAAACTSGGWYLIRVMGGRAG